MDPNRWLENYSVAVVKKGAISQPPPAPEADQAKAANANAKGKEVEPKGKGKEVGNQAKGKRAEPKGKRSEPQGLDTEPKGQVIEGGGTKTAEVVPVLVEPTKKRLTEIEPAQGSEKRQRGSSSFATPTVPQGTIMPPPRSPTSISGGSGRSSGSSPAQGDGAGKSTQPTTLPHMPGLAYVPVRGVLNSETDARKAGMHVPSSCDIEMMYRTSFSSLAEAALNQSVRTTAFVAGLVAKAGVFDRHAVEVQNLRKEKDHLLLEARLREAKQKRLEDSYREAEEEKAQLVKECGKLRLTCLALGSRAVFLSTKLEAKEAESRRAYYRHLKTERLLDMERDKTFRLTKKIEDLIEQLEVSQHATEEKKELAEANNQIADLQSQVDFLKSRDFLREVVTRYVEGDAFTWQADAIFRAGFDRCREVLRLGGFANLPFDQIHPFKFLSEGEISEFAAMDAPKVSVREALGKEKFIPIDQVDMDEVRHRVAAASASLEPAIEATTKGSEEQPEAEPQVTAVILDPDPHTLNSNDKATSPSISHSEVPPPKTVDSEPPPLLVDRSDQGASGMAP